MKKIILNPTFFIIDNNDRFILSIEGKNIEINANNYTKDIFYNVHTKILEGDYSFKTEEKEILNFLINNNMAYIKAHEEKQMLTFEEIKFDKDLMKITTVLNSEEKIYNVTIIQGKLIIFNDKTQGIFNNHDIDLLFMDYIEHVLKKRMTEDILTNISFNNQVCVIDIEDYTLPYSFYVHDDINIKNIMKSTFVVKGIEDYFLYQDYDKYFPMHTLVLKKLSDDTEMIAVGFTSEEALSNLIFIMKNHLEINKKFFYTQINSNIDEKYKAKVVSVLFPRINYDINQIDSLQLSLDISRL